MRIVKLVKVTYTDFVGEEHSAMWEGCHVKVRRGKGSKALSFTVYNKGGRVAARYSYGFVGFIPNKPE